MPLFGWDSLCLMVLNKYITKLLPVAILFAFALAGCLDGEAPEPDDDEGDGQDGNGLPDENDDEDGNGTAGGGGSGENGGNGDGGGDGGDNGDDKKEGDECVVSRKAVTSWSHDGPAVPDPTGFDPEGDPLMLIAAQGNETFNVEEGTEMLVIEASAGLHVTLGWNLAVLDPTGAEAYSFVAEPGAAENVTDGALMTDPSPGEWTLATSVTGYVEGLEIGIDADVCS